MQKKYIHTLLLIAALSLSVITIGCESQGPAEKAGEKVDESIEATKDTMEEAADKVDEKMEEATKEVEEAAKPSE